ncbi:MAG: hypothetical protein PHT53_00535 [Candidatus Omnitrophica bacterium]|nr:hypothetical protein [Candidatus Omnitrophota bacterium]
MKEKNINSLFLIFVSVIVAALAGIIIFNLKAYIIYEKISNMKLPAVKTERINYYNVANALVSQAIKLDKLNAEFLALKADLLFGLLNEDLSGASDIKKKEIENLYIKAINLNPINFEYHLKLGWFYAQINKTGAKEEIQKAIELYPSYYRNYLYLSKYYLKKQKDKEAFNHLLLTFYHSKNIRMRKIMDEIKEDLKDSMAFSFDEKKKQLSFSVFMPGPELNFKKYGFPHINIPLGVRVYIKNSVKPEVLMYKDNILSGNFKKIASPDDTDSYEFNIEPSMADIYLDDLAIKTAPPQAIEKIEFIKKFK